MKRLAYSIDQDLTKVFGIAPGSVVRFWSVEKGRQFLLRLTEKFVVSLKSSHQTDDAAVFWVKGFGIGEREREAGFLGSFVKIALGFDEEGCFASAEVVDEDIKVHPKRLRSVQATPDWGFWVLRRIKRRWRYGTFADAMRDIRELEKTYPKVTTALPNQDGFTVLIFSSVKDGSKKKPLKKYMLRIKKIDDHYVIDYHENQATFRSKGVRVNESYDGTFVCNRAIVKDRDAVEALLRAMNDNIEWARRKFDKRPPGGDKEPDAAAVPPSGHSSHELPAEGTIPVA